MNTILAGAFALFSLLAADSTPQPNSFQAPLMFSGRCTSIKEADTIMKGAGFKQTFVGVHVSQKQVVVVWTSPDSKVNVMALNDATNDTSCAFFDMSDIVLIPNEIDGQTY